MPARVEMNGRVLSEEDDESTDLIACRRRTSKEELPEMRELSLDDALQHF